MSDKVKFLLNQAIEKFQCGDYEQSQTLLSIALKINPKNFNALFLSGVVKGIQNNHSEALGFFQKALKIDPSSSLTHLNMGKALSELNRDRDAIKSYKQSSLIDPGNAEVWLGYGKSLQKLDDFNGAIDKYDTALDINGNYPEALANKALLLHYLDRSNEALEYFSKALRINENIPEIWANAGNTFSDIKDFENALICYKKALSISPSIDYLLGDYLYAKMQVADWTELKNIQIECINNVAQEKKVITPFQFLAVEDDPALQKICAQTFVAGKYENSLKPNLYKSKTKDHPKLKIGYLSPDFRNHPVSHLLAEVLESHNSDKYEIYGIYVGVKTNDSMHERLKTSFDYFLDCGKLSDTEISSRLKALDLNILVDLAGHTSKSRLGVFKDRVAPIQISYLGYPGTTGANFIDYIIADATIIPRESSEHYSEKPIYLPHCFQANDSGRQISQRNITREEFNIPPDVFVFCCFNNIYKLNPNIFDIWSQILYQVPNSVLWLSSTNNIVQVNLKNEMRNRGISECRIIFCPRAEYSNYLSSYRLADLFLDTLPFNAGTTASDALWAGLPVLTQSGKSFSGRMATSLLKSLFLNELISSSEQEYISIAVDLAKNPSKLASLKNKLAIKKSTSPLFDGKAFCRDIERAYEIIYKRFMDGEAPITIEIKSI
jgi:predicted O-linked N-acetylglucosamine transferase (SPINDLY family)